MITRRKTFQTIVSSMFLPTASLASLANAVGLSEDSRATQAACTTCVNTEQLKATFANVLDSAPLLKFVALPQVLLPVVRSGQAGVPVQFVESSTGNLVFGLSDIELKGLPAVRFSRYYDSHNETDNGLGRGWTGCFDDRIVLDGNKAVLSTASGDTVEFDGDASQSNFFARNPGLSFHKRISRVDQNTILEMLGDRSSRVYKRIGASYYLDTFDFGEIGSLQIVRDASARIQSITNLAAGLFIHFTWSRQGQLVKLEDSAARTIEFSYSGNSLIAHKDVAGAMWHYEYAAGGKLSQVVDPVGTTILEVAYLGQRVSQTKTIAGSMNYDYSSKGIDGIGSFSTTNAKNRVWVYEHNSNGQVVSVTGEAQADGATLTYDTEANLVATQFEGKTHQYTYDEKGRLTSHNNARHTKYWQYDGEGKAQSFEDAAGKTVYEYDSQGGLARAASPRKIRSYTSAMVKGRVSRLSTAKSALEFAYSLQGYLKSVKDLTGNSFMQFGYDDAGHLVSERITSSYSATARRNKRGELTDWSDSRGREFSFRRDARGALVQITNTSGEWARATRDTARRITGLSNSHGQTRSFFYDDSGTLTSWTDALNRTFSVEYDPVNGKTVQMREVNSGLRIVRGANGEAVMQAAAEKADTQTAANTSGSQLDGWQDPLYGHGLLGAFSGFSSYAAMEAASTSGTTVPPALASLLISGSMTTTAGDDYDQDLGDTTPPGGPYSGDSDTGDDYDGGGGDDYVPPGDSGGVPPPPAGGGGSGGGVKPPNPDCDPCRSAYQTACTNSYNNTKSNTLAVELLAVGACTLLIEAPPAYTFCVLSATAAAQASYNTADTDYNNCISLIPQNCYSQCQ